uniref:Gustatory receptor n=1 Tax=Anopheles stephensi TaxID=30069 RepID=A0A182YGH4_ANOST
MLQRSKHDAFVTRLRWALRAQNCFGVSSLTIDKEGRLGSGRAGPKIVLVGLLLIILLAVWFIYGKNESAFVCKSYATRVVLFYYFVIIETIIAIFFNVISTFKMAWPSSQESLAECWKQLIGKVQEIQALYRCEIESKQPFLIFWLWMCVLSLSYCVLLTYMVLTSAVLFIVQTNHFILYGLRIFSYLSHTAAGASFGLFAMLLRIVLVEMQNMIRRSTVSETQLRSMIQLYRHIHQIIECFCDVYGWVLLIIFFEHFLILTDRSFFAIRMYRLPMGFTFKQVLAMMMVWVFPLALNDMLLIGACVATDRALQEFEKQLCGLRKETVQDDSELTIMITSFALYVAERKPKFRILKSINLNFGLLYGVNIISESLDNLKISSVSFPFQSCGVIGTYLTVFLQFDSPNI